MAENQLLDVAQTVMIERFGLDETEYKLFKYSEGSKAITIGMTNGVIPVTASFPLEFMVYEQIKRWDDEKKEAYLRNLIAAGKELPEELLDSFHHLLVKLNLPTDKDEKVEKILDSVEEAKVEGTNITVKNKGNGKVKLKVAK